MKLAEAIIAESQGYIELGKSVFKDSEGNEHPVVVKIQKESGIPDVYVQLLQTKNDGLYADVRFVSSLNSFLSQLGYKGKKLERAELGMQGSKTVVFEGIDDFEPFAAKKGWKDARESEKDRDAKLNKLLNLDDYRQYSYELGQIIVNKITGTDAANKQPVFQSIVAGALKGKVDASKLTKPSYMSDAEHKDMLKKLKTFVTGTHAIMKADKSLLLTMLKDFFFHPDIHNEIKKQLGK